MSGCQMLVIPWRTARCRRDDDRCVVHRNEFDPPRAKVPPRARPVSRRDDKRVRDVPGKAAVNKRGKERLW
jgi:hypothetical protein